MGKLIIAFIVICIVIGILRSIWEAVSEAISDHKYFFITVGISIVGGIVVAVTQGSVNGGIFAVFALGTFLFVWILYRLAAKISKKIKPYLEKSHQQKFLAYLQAHTQELRMSGPDQTPGRFRNYCYPQNQSYQQIRDDFLVPLENANQKECLEFLNWNCVQEGQTEPNRVPLPELFRAYRYPNGKNYLAIVSLFLEEQQAKLCNQIELSTLKVLGCEPMMDQDSLYSRVCNRFRTCTTPVPLYVVFAQSLESLEAKKKIDRPLPDRKEIIHLLGATSGNNFTSQEIDATEFD